MMSCHVLREQNKAICASVAGMRTTQQFADSRSHGFQARTAELTSARRVNHRLCAAARVPQNTQLQNPETNLAGNLLLLLLVGSPLTRDRLGLRRHVLAIVAPVMHSDVRLEQP